MFWWTLYEVPKQWHEPPLHKIPSRSSVSGLSPYKYLDSEREIDAGEDPTQRVSEYLAYTSLVTFVHTWYATPYLLVQSRRSGAPLRRKPSPAGEYS